MPASPATPTRTSPMPSDAVKIVVPDDFPPAFTGSAAEAPLKKIGQVRVFTEPGADQEATLIERIGDAEAVVNIRAHARFSDRVLAACPKLRLISIWGAGTDNVDLRACKARGVTVTNTPGVNAHALAEHTIALMLAVTRRIPAMDRDMRAVSGRAGSSPSSRAAPWASSGSGPSGAASPCSPSPSGCACSPRPSDRTMDAQPHWAPSMYPWNSSCASPTSSACFFA